MEAGSRDHRWNTEFRAECHEWDKAGCLILTPGKRHALYHELEWALVFSSVERGSWQRSSQSFPVLPFQDDGFGVPHEVVPGREWAGSKDAKQRRKARVTPGWNWSSWSWQLGWVYCFGSLLLIHEALPHCLPAWQKRFTETESVCKDKVVSPQELTDMGCHLPQGALTPVAWFGSGIHPCPTPGALSSPQMVSPWVASCRNRQSSHPRACLCFSSLSCQGVINSWKKKGMLERDTHVTGYQNHKKGWKRMGSVSNLRSEGGNISRISQKESGGGGGGGETKIRRQWTRKQTVNRKDCKAGSWLFGKAHKTNKSRKIGQKKKGRRHK